MLSKLFYFVAGTLSVVYAAETTGVAYVRNVASDDYNSLTMKVVLTENSNNVRTHIFFHTEKKRISSLKLKTQTNTFRWILLWMEALR